MGDKMPLTKISLERFTAFENLDIEFSPGVNIFIGANGTGKTHLMKVLYSSCDITTSINQNFAEKLIRVFLPSQKGLGRLVKRHRESARCIIEISKENGNKLLTFFSNHAVRYDSATIRHREKWISDSIESVYIPVKEMLSNAPGFHSLYTNREIHFEEIYDDILLRSLKPMLKGPADRTRKNLLKLLQETIEGKVTIKNEEFFLKNKQGNLEFTLLSEGMRKLGLLWVLIQNGTLQNGSVLFWDEPETNLNPTIYGKLVDILLELQRAGVQIFLATHNYVILKEFDLRCKSTDKIKYYSLYRSNESKEIECRSTDKYLEIEPNLISETFDRLYDREIERSIKNIAGAIKPSGNLTTKFIKKDKRNDIQ
jgi:predicted ATP-dependent endonuclease of OLD family